MAQKELNAFELAFGFGKLLCKDWPHLFGYSEDDVQVESIGFNVLLDDDNWGHQGELWKHHTDKIVFSNIGLP